jgi:hypothetical protein
VVLIKSADCTEPRPETIVLPEPLVAGFGTDRQALRLRTSAIPPDAYLLIVYADADDQYPSEGPATTMLAAVKTAPTCYSP